MNGEGGSVLRIKNGKYKRGREPYYREIILHLRAESSELGFIIFQLVISSFLFSVFLHQKYIILLCYLMLLLFILTDQSFQYG